MVKTAFEILLFALPLGRDMSGGIDGKGSEHNKRN